METIPFKLISKLLYLIIKRDSDNENYLKKKPILSTFSSEIEEY